LDEPSAQPFLFDDPDTLRRQPASNRRMFAHNANEWLEADGRGGFASGTVNTIRTRRYHGLLLGE
jgi:hypothetical protein